MDYEEVIRRLTPTQLAILKLVCDGLNHIQIAQKLGYQPVTITWHMGHIYEKLGINDKNMHWQYRLRILKKDVCPLLEKPEVVFFIQKLDPVLDPVPEKPSEEVLAMVRFDETRLVNWHDPE